jgi:3-methyladenine DNA glycosylase AlkC
MIRLSAFLSVGLLPLPSKDAFYNIIFRLSDRCNRLRLPFGFARLYNFADEVFQASAAIFA